MIQSNSSRGIFNPTPTSPDCPINNLEDDHSMLLVQDAVAAGDLEADHLNFQEIEAAKLCYERQQSGACVVRFSLE